MSSRALVFWGWVWWWVAAGCGRLAYDAVGPVGGDADPGSDTATGPFAFDVSSANAINPNASTASISAEVSPLAPGELLVVVVGWHDAVASVASVADSAGNDFQSAASVHRGTTVSQVLYHARAGGAGTDTVTVTFDQNARGPYLLVLAYLVPEGTILAASIASDGTGTTATSGELSVALAPQLLVAADTVETEPAFETDPMFQGRVLLTHHGSAMDRVVDVPGTYSASAGLQTSGAWTMHLVALGVP